MTAANPLLSTWTTPFEVPPFDAIRPEHFRPAFDEALSSHRAEIDAIAGDPEHPNFENTILALESSGEDLRKVASTFFNLAGADTNDAIQAIEREIAPVLSRHRTETVMNRALFERLADLWARRDVLGLDAEQARVLERTHTGFVRAGAKLEGRARERMGAVSERLAVIGTQFSQNVLADEKAFEMVLDESDVGGLPEAVKAAARAAGEARGHPEHYVVTLARSSVEPFLTFADRRDLREQAWRAWSSRGETGGETDNRALISEMVALRAERAKLLGFDSFAHFKLDDQMAKTPDAVRDLLVSVWEPAKRRASDEGERLEAMMAAGGHNFAIEPWDWRYYAEKLRRAEYDIDEAELKPYLRLDAMIEAAFDVAGRLFGLAFSERRDIPLYHPDVRAFEVKDRSGRHVGLFLGDYFARPSKRSGAWMSGFRGQHRIARDGKEVRPVVVNVCNFAKAPEGEETLLTLDDARTLFHEFGHALHGLLSDVTYPSIAGTSVARDFVELPSQLYEHWLLERDVLSRFARHHETGAAIPDALVDRVIAAKTFNQGWATVEYVSSALVDLDLHVLDEADAAGLDVVAFEAKVLDRLGMPKGTAMRHRTPHFSHVFSGDGYSAGYYSYLWSEVMDADAFRAFEETGDIFHADTAERLKRHVYSAGGREGPDAAYRAFRGRMPAIDALLAKRGLAAPTPAA